MRFAHQVDGKPPAAARVVVGCEARGRIPGGVAMYCDLGLDHQGPHWDHEDRMWWEHEEEEPRGS